MTVRVVLAEDQALVRAGLLTILGTDPAIEVVGEAVDGNEAVQLVAAHRPDLALQDVRMPHCDGLQATRRIVAEVPSTRVLVLTTFGQDEVVFEALQSGAAGFLLKDTRPEDLLAAVHAVAAGESRRDPAVTAAVVSHVRRHRTRATAHPVDRLTPREREVVLLMARGLSNAEVAAELVLSTGTVKTHVASLLGKLGARDRVQAVIAAFESGLAQA
jgi:DNA-binding NarL/FixJ family response regulator